MVNSNGVIQDSDLQLTVFNRSFLYGDGVFETIRMVDGKILFFEDHYFRLMSSMRIVRMEIPMSFTMEFLEEEILKLVTILGIQDSARVRLTVFRNEGGYYTPTDNSVSFIIQAEKLGSKKYDFGKESYEVDLYKDFFVSKHLLSSLKTTSKMINVTAGIFAKENRLDSCLLINEEKNVVEAVSGNLFMLMGNQLVTPPISEGCLNGVMRKQIIGLAKKMDEVQIIEKEISPFDLQKADELFVTNVISGIQPVTKYRKKEFSTVFSGKMLEKLNESIGG